jgi:hypothetical protein
MNRIQFWILIAGSSLVVVLLLLQSLFAHRIQFSQGQAMRAQEVVAQGRSCDTRLRQLLYRIGQVAQQTQDQALKDLLTRQGFTIKANNPEKTTPSETETAAPSGNAPAFQPAH